MYLLKVKGEKPMPEHIQIRDENFKLLIYCKTASLKSHLKKHNLLFLSEKINNILIDLKPGFIKKIN